MHAKDRRLRVILITFLVVLTADQVSKAIVMALIEVDRPPDFDVFFQFTHQRNPGLVGGMFREVPALAYVLPVFATGILVYLYRFLDPKSIWQTLAFGMVFGGAVGNLIDRFRLGSVTDFLQVNFYFIPFDFPWKFYPAFNVADSSVCVGVAILVITWNLAPPPEKSNVPGTV